LIDANVIVGGIVPSALVTLGSGYWLYRHFAESARARRDLDMRLADLDRQRDAALAELNNMRRPISDAEATHVLDVAADIIRGHVAAGGEINFTGSDSGPAPTVPAAGEPTLMEAWRD